LDVPDLLVHYVYEVRVDFLEVGLHDIVLSSEHREYTSAVQFFAGCEKEKLPLLLVQHFCSHDEAKPDQASYLHSLDALAGVHHHLVRQQILLRELRETSLNAFDHRMSLTEVPRHVSQQTFLGY